LQITLQIRKKIGITFNAKIGRDLVTTVGLQQPDGVTHTGTYIHQMNGAMPGKKSLVCQFDEWRVPLQKPTGIQTIAMAKIDQSPSTMHVGGNCHIAKSMQSLAPGPAPQAATQTFGLLPMMVFQTLVVEQ
ncbi:MAG TPA: hypothetical protein PKM19_02335, partial [Pseudomonadales bacterium]|nr:hypothetical protein [Pseudomonadales bacterium]